MKKLHKRLTKNLANYKRLLKDKERVLNATFYAVNNKEWQRAEHLQNVNKKIKDNLENRYYLLCEMNKITTTEIIQHEINQSNYRK